MTESGISLQPIFPLWAIGIGFVGLFSFLVWKEMQRRTHLLLWRIIAVGILLMSISGLMLQPSLKSDASSKGIVLLTPHYKKETVDSLREANAQLTYLRTSDALSYPDTREIATFSELNEQDIRFVLGDGLPYYALEGVKGYYFLKGELSAGIVQITQPTFRVNQLNTISGLIRCNGKSKIGLISPGRVEDSVEFSSKGLHSFMLSFTPKQAGLFVYAIEVHEGNDVISQRLPIEVATTEKLNILFIQNYPTAEAKYLKNFLIEQGHGIVARYQLSKNNYRYEYANHDQLKLDRLSLDLLNSFDLLVIDNETIALSNGSDKKVLEESVANGLGVLQLFNSVDKNNKTDFFTIPIKDFAKDTVLLKLGTATFTLASLPAVINSNNTSTLQTKDRVLSGFANKGAGKLGFQFLQETYRLILQGNQIEYALLWSPLIEGTARVKILPFKIQLENEFPVYPDEPIDLNVVAAKEDITLEADGVPLPLREDVVVDNFFHGKTWAGKHGWHQFKIKGDSIVKNYYVSQANEWQSLRIAQQQKANEIRSKQMNYKSHIQKQIKLKPIPVWVFFIIFLLSAGFLWLAPKL